MLHFIVAILTLMIVNVFLTSVFVYQTWKNSQNLAEILVDEEFDEEAQQEAIEAQAGQFADLVATRIKEELLPQPKQTDMATLTRQENAINAAITEDMISNGLLGNSGLILKALQEMGVIGKATMRKIHKNPELAELVLLNPQIQKFSDQIMSQLSDLGHNQGSPTQSKSNGGYAHPYANQYRS